MNTIAKRCSNLLSDCMEVLQSLDTISYSEKCGLLNGASIGMHFRHILELLQCLKNAEEVLCYDERKRDTHLETSLSLALEESTKMQEWLISNDLDFDKSISLKWTSNEGEIRMNTNLQRELAYNLEHIVHHMALMRVGLKELLPSIIIPKNFGVADSTQRFRQQTA
jgi:hypothetical protein